MPYRSIMGAIDIFAETAASTWDGAARHLPRVARGNISVLVLGETGVGKEVTAKEVHRRSLRADGPFVAIHCAAIPESLLEAELFGYERGAFTGAVASKPGLLESAHGGTAFLDEIAEVPLATQVKLLRVVETKSVMRLGALRPRPIDVRFIAAANQDLEALAASGRFRADLYYRLAGFTLNVPPLRARPRAIAALTAEIAKEASFALGRPAPVLSREARACLERYAWPGNVRELKNAVECAVLLAVDGTISPEHLPPRVAARGVLQRGAESALGAVESALHAGGAPRAKACSLAEEVRALERARILEALERTAGNQSRAARELGISRHLLIERLESYGVPRPRKGKGSP